MKLCLLACLLCVLLIGVTATIAQGNPPDGGSDPSSDNENAGAGDCFQRLGGMGTLCRRLEPELTLEVRGFTSSRADSLLLQVTQAQVAAAGPGNQVLTTPDGRVAVRHEVDGNVTVSMGPDAEGQVHHVTLEQDLNGAVIATFDTQGGPPGEVAAAAAIAAENADATPDDSDAPAATGPAGDVAPQPAPESASVIHVVRPGDTLFAIALSYQVGLNDLIERNGLVDGGNLLRVGQELLIGPAPMREEQEEEEEETEVQRPAHCEVYDPVVHVVRPGESLYNIALAYDVHPETLYIRNQLPDKGRHLLAGQELVIPGVTRPEARGKAVPEECVSDKPVVHVVQQGHTPGAIALAWGIELQELIELNGLAADGGLIVVGQELIIVAAPDRETADETTPQES